jgi:hypothetical protein
LLQKFHKDQVVPFGRFPDPPELDLIVAVQCGNLSALWATEKSAARKIAFYEAVGVGRMYAKELLGMYYSVEFDCMIAAVLATYVISKVKTVEGCGRYTDVAISRSGHVIRLSRVWTVEPERRVGEFDWLQNRALSLALTSPSEHWDEDLSRFVTRLKKVRDELRNWQHVLFQKSNDFLE